MKIAATHRAVLAATAALGVFVWATACINKGYGAEAPLAVKGVTTKPATQATNWHRKLEPWVDNNARDPVLDPGYDPAYVWLSEPGARVDQREGAFQFLLTTTTFTYEVEGACATVSYHARAFQTLVKQPDAKELFSDLLERGNDVGKLYGLCGLRETEDFLEFRKRIAPFRERRDVVASQFGCMVGKESVGSIAEGIVAGSTPRKLLHPYREK